VYVVSGPASKCTGLAIGLVSEGGWPKVNFWEFVLGAESLKPGRRRNALLSLSGLGAGSARASGLSDHRKPGLSLHTKRGLSLHGFHAKRNLSFFFGVGAGGECVSVGEYVSA
jgi:hypothetical protein